MRRIAAALGSVAICILITGVLCEASLRIQQKLGPLYDLKFAPEQMAIFPGLLFSDVVNHVQMPGPDWDENGVARLNVPNAPDCAPKILFLGDSFMQGYPRSPNAVPLSVRASIKEATGREPCVLNAGQVSYSPSIYTVLAKRLIPLLRPDIVLIDIDETDLYDENYRYRELTVRDEAGTAVAVRPTPWIYRYNQAKAVMGRHWFYIHRLIDRIYIEDRLMPRLVREYNEGREQDIFFAQRLPAAEARAKHAAELAYFASTLDGLTRTAVELMGSADRLVYLHHPYLEHLEPAGPAYNDVVPAIVAAVAARYGVRFYDATADMRGAAGSAPESLYLPDDGHFNDDGYRAYGVAIAKYLMTMLDAN